MSTPQQRRKTYTVASAQQYLGARDPSPTPPSSPSSLETVVADSTSPKATRTPKTSDAVVHYPCSTTAYSTATTDLTTAAAVSFPQTTCTAGDGRGYNFPTPKTFSPTDEIQEREKRGGLRYRASSDTLGRSGVLARGLGKEFRKLQTSAEGDEYGEESGYGSGEESEDEATTPTGLEPLSLDSPITDSTERVEGRGKGRSVVPIIASPLPTPKHRSTANSPPFAAATSAVSATQLQISVTSSPTSPPSAGSSIRRGRFSAYSPHSSAGSNSTEIYFSPIDATRSQVFLSSPLPSPPLPIPSASTSAGSSRATTPELRIGAAPGLEEELGAGTGLVADFGLGPGRKASPGNRNEMQEVAGIGRMLEGVGITLSLQQLDALTLSLAISPLVQKHIRNASSHHPAIHPRATGPVVEARGILPSPPPSPPAPPLSYPSSTTLNAGIGGVALLDPTAPGVPVRLSSSPCLAVGTSACLHLPPGVTTSSTLRIEPASHFQGESSVVLQILVAVLPRGASARGDNGGEGARDEREGEDEGEVLLAEVDVTTTFQRAALTELASSHRLSLDDVQITTPISQQSSNQSLGRDPDSDDTFGTDAAAGRKKKGRAARLTTLTTLTHWPSSESLDVDWCAIGNSPRSPSLSRSDTVSSTASTRRARDPATPPDRLSFAQDILSEAQARLHGLDAERCTMQTLTLLSELRRLGREHSEFLVLQPTRRDEQGRVGGVKIPSISPALQRRLRSTGRSGGRNGGSSGRDGATTPGSLLTATNTTGGSGVPVSKARRFRETILEAVGPHLRAEGEGEGEFEGRVALDSGVRIGVRCVPVFSEHGGEGKAERWVCFCGV